LVIVEVPTVLAAAGLSGPEQGNVLAPGSGLEEVNVPELVSGLRRRNGLPAAGAAAAMPLVTFRLGGQRTSSRRVAMPASVVAVAVAAVAREQVAAVAVAAVAVVAAVPEEVVVAVAAVVAVVVVAVDDPISRLSTISLFSVTSPMASASTALAITAATKHT
jgi:hypothetical protein